MLIIHLNIRSLVNKIDLIRQILVGSTIDCLCLTETWLREIITNDLISVKGYVLWRVDRDTCGESKKGGGICVYIKDKFDTELILSRIDGNLEVLGVKFRSNNSGRIDCFTVYRPPKGNINLAIEGLHNIATQWGSVDKMIVHGDFNIDYSNNLCKWSKKLKEWEVKYSLTQLVKHHSRISLHSKSLIDLCFTNVRHINSSGLINMNLSDHFATFIIRKKLRGEKKSKCFTGRDYSKFCPEAVVSELNNNKVCLVETDPESSWDSMVESFSAVADKLCPMKTFKIKNDRPEYFNSALSEAIKDRDESFRKARTCNFLPERKDLWQKAVKKRTEVKIQLRKAKRKFIIQKLDESKGEGKKYWKHMNSLLHRKNTVTIKEIISPGGVKVEGVEAANLINEYYCDVGKKLAENITPTGQRFDLPTTMCRFKWDGPISESEVLGECKKLDCTKSSGIVQLSTKILKECLIGSVSNFTKLLNSCVDLGIFPAQWKRATVIPIPKGNKQKTLGNIRPISLLPTPGKIFERLIYNRLYDYLQMNELLSSKQAGFRRNFGVHDPLIDLVNFINLKFNESKYVVCVFVDLAKAFNSLNNNILLSKLYSLGVDGNTLQLLESYTKGREQVTNLNGSISDVGKMEYGVAQGSILGPLLFSIYMNDLPMFFKHMDVRMYADDTILFCELDTHDNPLGKIRNINDELSILNNWCRANSVTINADKTKFMVFSPNKRKFNNDFADGLPDLVLNDKHLGHVLRYRYLGVELDWLLTMEYHVNYIVERIRPKIYTLGKIRCYIQSDTAIMIYKSLMLPIIEYGFYLICNKQHIIRLQKIQNKILRLCFNTERVFPSFQLHTRARLLSLDLRQACSLLNFINIKLLKGDTTYEFDDRKDNRVRDSKWKLKVTFPKTERFKKSICYTVPTLWNKLPKECRENHMPLVFKKSVRRAYWAIFNERNSVYA